MLSKQNLRNQMKGKRRALAEQTVLQGSADVLSQLLSAGICQPGDKICLYLPMHGEVDITAIFTESARYQLSFYLPVIDLPQPGMLNAAPYAWGEQLQLNKYYLLEPFHQTELRSLEDMNVVLMPVVAFNVKGGRLGQGGGYYDRSLSKAKKRPLRVGLAYDWQQSDGWEVESWDVPMQFVITPSEIISCSG